MKNFNIYILICLSLVLMLTQTSIAQKDRQIIWSKLESDYKIKPFMMVQLWGVYTNNLRADFDGDGVYEAVGNRFNPHIRRARLGFKATPYRGLNFTVVAYYDGIGRDNLGASIGPANNPHGTDLGIWDAFFQWQPFVRSKAVNIVAGFFRPQLGRESITSGYATTSGEKAMQQSYVRKHLVGTGPGRAAGINIGGLLLGHKVGLNYNVGLFHPNNTSRIANTNGVDWSPLLVARTVLYLGDPEMTSYKIGYQTNYYNQRHGLSLGVSTSFQGNTDFFTNSSTTSFDFLFNWGRLNLDGDFHMMQRSLYILGDAGAASDVEIDYTSSAGHIRLGYNLNIANKLLEPVVMLNFFEGGETEQEKANANTVKAFSGTEKTCNLGMNYYLNKHRLKLLLHYVNQRGTEGRNIFSSQGGIPIQRGDYLMFGLNAIF